MILILLIAASCHCANITSISPSVAFSEDSSDTIVQITGFDMDNVTGIWISGKECKSNDYKAVYSPCFDDITRNQVCEKVNQPSLIIPLACDYTTGLCVNASNGNAPCVNQQNANLCTAIGCIGTSSICTLILKNNIDDFRTQKGFIGAPCGQNKTCSSDGMCMQNDMLPRCKGTIECKVANITTGFNNVTVSFVSSPDIIVSDAVRGLRPPRPMYMVSVATDKYQDMHHTPIVTGGTIFAITYEDVSDVFLVTLVCSINGSVIFQASDRFPINARQQAWDYIFCDMHVTYPDFNTTLIFTSESIRIQYTKLPSVFSTCPSAILSNIDSVVNMQGEGFINTTSLGCIFDGASSPAHFINSQFVVCTVRHYNTTNTSIYIDIGVSNDMASFNLSPSKMTVSGACESTKQNSVAVGTLCVCKPGHRDVSGFCEPCGYGTYQPDFDQLSCIPCDITKDTNETLRATSESQCVCKEGFLPMADGTCQSCPWGLICSQKEGIIVSPGYWISKSGETHTEQCEYGKHQCSGGKGHGDALCADGYMGPRCAVCADEYGPLGGECVKCPVESVNGVIVAAIFFLSATVFYLLVRTSSYMQKDGEIIGETMKIMFNFLQVLYYVGKSSANWNRDSSRLFSGIIPVTLSSSFVSIQCSSQFDFYEKIAIMMTLPATMCMIVSIIVGMSHALVRRNSDELALERILDLKRYCVVVLVMIHPAISHDVIRSLQCEKVAGTETSFMSSDMRVDCESESYKSYRIVAILYIFLYVIGFLVVVYRKMKKAQGHIQLVASNLYPLEARIFVFMSMGYTSESYMWEFFIIIRKLAIVCINSIFTPSIQMLWTTFVIFISMSSTIAVSPHLNRSSHILELVSLGTLSFVAMLGMHGELLQDPDRAVIFYFLVISSVSAFIFMCAMFFFSIRIHVLDFFLYVYTLLHPNRMARIEFTTYENPMLEIDKK